MTSQADSAADPRRLVPRTDRLLADPTIAGFVDELGLDRVKTAIHAAQQEARQGQLEPARVLASVRAELAGDRPSSLRPVINATGVVLHTNLGRAPLSPLALRALIDAAGYVDVEFDLDTGQRAQRGRGALAALRAAVPSAGDVLVVNNCAAALVLAVTALARSSGAEAHVLMSRGELVEIGDGFRLPELIASTGVAIREVGTTNRTHPADYARALDQGTVAILKVHPSNFRIEGFTAEASVAELAEVVELAKLACPVVVDIGSGLLAPDALVPDEPDVASTLAAGADLVLCSGDKLLGGPQSGLIFGRADLIQLLRRDPLARALRVDKLTLAALEASVAGPPTPTARFLHLDPAALRERALALAAAVSATAGPSLDANVVEVVEVSGAVGGGGAPSLALPGWGLALPEAIAERLRSGEPAVVGRVESGRCLLDLRCVPPEQDAVLAKAIIAALASG